MAAGSEVTAAACACGKDCGCTPAVRDDRWLRNARYARWLAWASLVWMLAEAALGLAAGVAAGSVALSGWAAGSAIEGAASLIVVWRFTGSRIQSPDAERRAQRAVAVSFWLLAAWIAAGALRSLADHREVAASALGIALTASSVVIMPVLGITKRRLAQRLGSSATAGEGTQNLMCAAQAAAVLAGLAVVAIRPAWSATDQIIALGIAAWSVWEGRRSWRGAGCC
jgi:divalent metal cation (Fe/Co/Zn/Cd) transporter